MSTDHLIPATGATCHALWLLDDDDVDDACSAPVVAWAIDPDRGEVAWAVALGLVSPHIELSDGTIVDVDLPGCRWPGRATWVDDMRAAEAEGVAVTKKWVDERRRARTAASNGTADTTDLTEVKLAIILAGRRCQGTLSRTAWIARVRPRRRLEIMRTAFDELVADGSIVEHGGAFTLAP